MSAEQRVLGAVEASGGEHLRVVDLLITAEALALIAPWWRP